MRSREQESSALLSSGTAALTTLHGVRVRRHSSQRLQSLSVFDPRTPMTKMRMWFAMEQGVTIADESEWWDGCKVIQLMVVRGGE